MKTKIFLIGFILILVFMWMLKIPLLNTVGIIVDRGYHIPKESSIFSFRCLMMNEGSGEWWIYGEDEHHYYFQGNHGYKTGYIIFPKSKASLCPNFNKLDYSTWHKTYAIHCDIP